MISIRTLELGSGGRLTANVTEFPVFEDEKVFSHCDFLEILDCAVGEVVDDVGVGLENAY